MEEVKLPKDIFEVVDEVIKLDLFPPFGLVKSILIKYIERYDKSIEPEMQNKILIAIVTKKYSIE